MRFNPLKYGLWLLLLFIQPIFPQVVDAAPAEQSLPHLNLPPGFQDETIVPGLLAPRAFVFAPDFMVDAQGVSRGRMFILERGSVSSTDINLASVRIFKAGTLLPTRALTITVCGDSERGLLGMALDPAFSVNGYVYLYYTRQAVGGSAKCPYNYYQSGKAGPYNRISRFTMIGDTINPASERILVDNIVTDAGYHNAGDLHFGADGYLYVSTGDGGIASLSPLTDNLNGKILRIKPTNADPRGYSTTGNPFDLTSGARNCGTTPPETGAAPCREVFAYGFRNPFRFTIPSGTSDVYVADVGGRAWEEVNRVLAGKDYGWPTREGSCVNGVTAQNGCNPNLPPPLGFTNPIYAYAHVNLAFDAAITGVVYYNGIHPDGMLPYPTIFRSNIYLTDYTQGFVRRLKFNPNAQVWEAQTPDFATSSGGIIGLQQGPDGNIFYLSLNFSNEGSLTSEVRRIRYVGGNLNPLAQASVNPVNAPDLSTAYTFSAAGSSDPDNHLPLKYTWNFGGATNLGSTYGPTTNLTVPNVVYTTAGKKTVTLTVTDSGNPPQSGTATVQVFPGNAAPNGTIQLRNLTVPTRQDLFYAGDTWEMKALNLTDDKTLSANPVSWDVVFHHNTHTHPFLSGLVGLTKTFTIPQVGEYDPNVWYRVQLNITDSDGLRTTLYTDLLPKKATITLQTDKPGGQIIMDGVSYLSPKTVTRVAGMQIPIDVPSPQPIGGVPYLFTNWSNGGTQAQTIIVPANDTVYTAAITSGNDAPALNIVPTHNLIVNWTRISWADAYEVQVSQNLNFTPLILVGDPVSAASTALALPCLNNGVYYWRVRALRFFDSIPGLWSVTQTFTIDAPGNCP